MNLIFNSDLSHMHSVTRSAFVHLKNISKIRPFVSLSDGFITSKLDNCSSLFSGLHQRPVKHLQLVFGQDKDILSYYSCSKITGSNLDQKFFQTNENAPTIFSFEKTLLLFFSLFILFLYFSFIHVCSLFLCHFCKSH